MLHPGQSAKLTAHLQSLHWLPIKVRGTYKIACLCYHCHSSNAPSYIFGMLQQKTIIIFFRLTPIHTACFFSINLHTAWHHLVITHHFLPILSGTLFQIMSGVSHHCYHLRLVLSLQILINVHMFMDLPCY